MIPIIVCLLLYFVWNRSNALKVENESFPDSVKLGEAQLHISSTDTNKLMYAVVQCINKFDIDIDSGLIRDLLKCFESFSHVNLYERTIADCHETTRLESFNIFKDISTMLNICAGSIGGDTQELMYKLSLFVWEGNYASAKNFGYILEYSGLGSSARYIFEMCYKYSRDVGCHIHSCATVPLVFYSLEQAEWIFLRSLRKYFELLRSPSPLDSIIGISDRSNEDDAYNLLRELPINAQYIGFSPGRLFELLSLSMVHYIPSIEYSFISNLDTRISGTNNHLQKPRGQSIRLCLVSEHYGNTSPGLCVQEIMIRLSELFRDDISIIFLDRGEHLNTVFADVMRHIAKESIDIQEKSLIESRKTIASANCDAILYIALGTDKITHLLAHARLAPVQILLGIGHPVSSGIRAVDYAIVPAAMLPANRLGRELFYEKDSITCAWFASNCDEGTIKNFESAMISRDRADLEARSPGQIQRPASSGDAANNQADSLFAACQIPEKCVSADPYYTEQLVIFDTLSHVISYAFQFTTLEEKDKAGMIRLSKHRVPENPTSKGFHSLSMRCAELSAILSQAGVSFFVTAEEIGCRSTAARRHIYHALQYTKKIHPFVDKIFLHIIRIDRMAKVLVVSGVEAILPRLVRSHRRLFGEEITEERLREHFVFIPKLSHAAYIGLLGASSVFINPVPFGSGMTSAESLAMCVPMIVLPRYTSVVHFAEAQLGILGQDLLQLLTVNSTVEYAQRAVQLVSNTSELNYIRDLICERNHKLFSEELIAATTVEWGNFIKKAVRLSAS